MAVAAVLAGAALLLVKGLYPQGGHDYYQHYSQFYAAVIDNHGIWPNLFWYEYYYSKGMGVTFLGMLLTDALAPSLVAYCFVAATALALYALVTGLLFAHVVAVAGGRSVPGAQRAYAGDGSLLGNGGWGHFQKPHELNSPLMFAVLWMSVAMVRSTGDVRRVWWFGAIGLCLCRRVYPACLAADRRAVRCPCGALFLRQKPRGLQDVPGHRGLDRRRVGFPPGAELPDDRRTGRYCAAGLVADRRPASVER